VKREKRREKREKLRTRGKSRAIFAFCQCLAKMTRFCRTLANLFAARGMYFATK
jgi:hypothetical protein